MKKEMSPIVVGVIVVVVLAIIGFLGYRAFQPADYKPSPGWDRGRNQANTTGAPNPNSGGPMPVAGAPAPVAGAPGVGAAAPTGSPMSGGNPMQPGRGNSPTSGPFGPPGGR